MHTFASWQIGKYQKNNKTVHTTRLLIMGEHKNNCKLTRLHFFLDFKIHLCVFCFSFFPLISSPSLPPSVYCRWTCITSTQKVYAYELIVVLVIYVFFFFFFFAIIFNKYLIPFKKKGWWTNRSWTWPTTISVCWSEVNWRFATKRIIQPVSYIHFVLSFSWSSSVSSFFRSFLFFSWR